MLNNEIKRSENITGSRCGGGIGGGWWVAVVSPLRVVGMVVSAAELGKKMEKTTEKSGKNYLWWLLCVHVYTHI